MSRTPSSLVLFANWPKFKGIKKMSCSPYGLAVAIIGKKEGKTKMSRMPSGLAGIAIGQKNKLW
jgi:hypothetical protein